MNTFASAARNETNYTRTENGAVALLSTESALVDLFAKAGSLSEKTEAEVASMFKSAFAEDKLLAVKLMFYTRNIRGGLGQRKTFRSMLRSLAKSNPDIVIKNMELIPLFGRYDDLYTLVGTEAEKAMWFMLSETLREDYDNMRLGKSVSLCAKWLKSVNTSSKESVELGKLTAKKLRMTEREYRKTLSSLRKYIDIVERKMSAGQWHEIEYSHVTSRAMKNYRKAFGLHDAEGFGSYIAKVTKGEAKINSATLYPYDILEAGHLKYSFSRNGAFRIDEDPVLELQWKALPNYVTEGINALVMADTSGSMEMVANGRPMAISIGLAVYFAERNVGAYKDLFLTFSESPKFVNLKGNTLAEKISKIESIVANTNLEAAMDLILDVAISNHVPQEEMPKSLIVISDMHFDQATIGNRRQTFHQSMKDKFAKAGYTMPTVIYWNVNERASALQAKANDEGVILVSGAATSTFKSIISNIGRTPYTFMLETLNDKMYDVVKI